MVLYRLHVKRMKLIVLQNSLYFTRFNAGPHRNSVYICPCAWLHRTQHVASTKPWSLVLYILVLFLFRIAFRRRKSTTCKRHSYMMTTVLPLKKSYTKSVPELTPFIIVRDISRGGGIRRKKTTTISTEN